MKERILKILGITLLLGILLFVFLAKNQIKILWIHKKAIANYQSNIEAFNSIQTNQKLECYYFLTLHENDSINLTILNLDIKSSNLPSDSQAWRKFDNMVRVNIDTIRLDSFIPSTGKVKIITGNGVEELTDWSIEYNGHKTNQKLSQALKRIGINQNEILEQISNLKNINCRSIQTHKEGIEFTYDSGFVFQAGCVIKKRYPIKYNIGNGNFLSSRRMLKVLDKRTRCYISY